MTLKFNAAITRRESDKLEVVVRGFDRKGIMYDVVLTKRDVNDLLSAITSAYRLTAK